MERYGIKIISEKIGIPSSTLRYYEKVGLLKGVERDHNGLRLYNQSHLDRLEGIKCFKDGGLPIAKICEFYAYDDSVETYIEDIITLVEKHEADLSVTITKMQKQLLHIQQKIRFYHGIKKAIEHGENLPCFDDYA